jgi:hypothetical protein
MVSLAAGAYEVRIGEEPCGGASEPGARTARAAPEEGMPLLAWLGGEDAIDAILVCPPHINQRQRPLTEPGVRERFARSIGMDSMKDAWHYAPYTAGTVLLKDGTCIGFAMYLSGLVVDGYLFAIPSP